MGETPTDSFTMEFPLLPSSVVQIAPHVLMAVVIVCLTLAIVRGAVLLYAKGNTALPYPLSDSHFVGPAFSPDYRGAKVVYQKPIVNKEMSKMNKVVRFVKNHGGKLLAGASAGVASVSVASAQITNAVITQMEGTFDQTQTLGESASIVAGTLALISIAVSFIWRARG